MTSQSQLESDVLKLLHEAAEELGNAKEALEALEVAAAEVDKLVAQKLVKRFLLCQATSVQLEGCGLTRGAAWSLKFLFPLPAGRPPASGTSQGPTEERPRRPSGEEKWTPNFEQELKERIRGDLQDWKTKKGGKFPTWTCPPSHRYSKALQDIPKFLGKACLLLHDLPNKAFEGVSEAESLWGEICELRARATEEEIRSAVRHVTLGLGPSGCGKTRTNLELLSARFGFYWTFNWVDNPGPSILETAVKRLEARPDFEGSDAWRRLELLRTMQQRLLLLHLLALDVALDEGLQPKDFLLFQLMGRETSEELKSWQECAWNELINICPKDLAGALSSTKSNVLQRLKEQAFIPVVIDEAQLGLAKCLKFPSGNPATPDFLRPLLNGMTRNLAPAEFDAFHHIFTGTGFSMRTRSDVASRVAKQVGEFHIFYQYGTFSEEEAVERVCKFLHIKGPEDDSRLWYFKGRYRFVDHLLQQFLILGEQEGTPEQDWVAALSKVVEVHTNPELGAVTGESLLNPLTDLLQGKFQDWHPVIEALKKLLKAYFFLGAACLMMAEEVDLVNLGFCFLAKGHAPHGVKDYWWAALAEPMVAVGLRNLLTHKKLWSVESAGEEELQRSCHDASALGIIWECMLSEQQQTFLESKPMLAHHPLLMDDPGAQQADFLKQKAQFAVLDSSGRVCVGAELVPERASKGRGLIEYIRQPNRQAVFFPEPMAGPDLVHFFKLGEDLWLALAQANFRKDLRGQMAAAFASVYPESMFGSGPQAEANREKLLEALRERDVKGLLHMVVAYPYEANMTTLAEKSSQRFQELKHLKLLVNGRNAEHYFSARQIALFDSLKVPETVNLGASGRKRKRASMS